MNKLAICKAPKRFPLIVSLSGGETAAIESSKRVVHVHFWIWDFPVSFNFWSWLLFLRPSLAFSSEFTRLEEYPGAKPPSFQLRCCRRRLLHIERRLLRIEVIRREKVLLQCKMHFRTLLRRRCVSWRGTALAELQAHSAVERCCGLWRGTAKIRNFFRFFHWKVDLNAWIKILPEFSLMYWLLLTLLEKFFNFVLALFSQLPQNFGCLLLKVQPIGN